MTVTDSLRILFWWPDRCFVDALRRCSRVVVATERHACVASSACAGEAWPQRVCAQRLKGRARRLVAVAARTMLASFTSCEGVECWAAESADGVSVRLVAAPVEPVAMGGARGHKEAGIFQVGACRR